MSAEDASARVAAAGTTRWLFRRGSLPLLTAVAAALALGLQLAGWLHRPLPPRGLDDAAAPAAVDDSAQPLTLGRLGATPAATARRTLGPPAPLRGATPAPGGKLAGPPAVAASPTPLSYARRTAAPPAIDLTGAAGPEPAAGPDEAPQPPRAAAPPEPPAMVSPGPAPPASDAVTAPAGAVPVAPPISCPTSVEGLEDVAADLVARRARFDEREMALRLRAAALEEAERRLAQRAAELEQLAGELQARSGELDAAQAARIARLVKVYEAMKPKQAAEVFDRLPLDLAVGVAAEMREVKIAAVLAAMSPDRAQRLTTELARLRRPPAEPAGPASR